MDGHLDQIDQLTRECMDACKLLPDDSGKSALDVRIMLQGILDFTNVIRINLMKLRRVQSEQV